MKEQLKQRLAELQTEFDNGQQKLNQLNSETQQIQQTLLRISGAIQVLEEELKKAEELGEAAITATANGMSSPNE